MKIWHQYPPRPKPEKPGSLVEIDTIHVGEAGDQLLIYTLINVHSRWTHALPVPRINRIPMDLRIWQKEIPQYIRYYNTERPHMGLGMKTPAEALTMVPSY
jgi:transposase InsO family protein